jgi:VWFA-related protein
MRIHSRSGRHPGPARKHSVLIATLAFCLAWSARAQPQSQAATNATAEASTTTSQADRPSAEITTHDEATTFKVHVNLVLVRAVVHDSRGRAVGNLHKDDFLLFDNRKPQVITQFSAEQAGSKPAITTEQNENPASPEKSAEAAVGAIPQSFIAYLFDDVHLAFGDLERARDAADKHLSSLRPTDRVALFTTSGQNTVDFTDDRLKLHQALLNLQPRPITGGGVTGCFNLTYYMAKLIEDEHDPQALQVATMDALACDFGNDSRLTSAAQQEAEATARQKLAEGSHESHIALTVIENLVRRLSVMPGQRSIVLVSPGFLTPELEFEYSSAIDHAVRSQVTIGALDARGLYVVPPGGDITAPTPPSALSAGLRQQYLMAEASADGDILQILSDATGGSYFHNNNDLAEGFRQVASTPEYSYVLGFSPANLKLDGHFHALKVTLKNPEHLTVQARRGYFAPKHEADPAQEAKQEIEDALFSQEEMHSLPVQLHTQFFKSSDVDAKLTVLAHIDVRQLRLRKAEGRNNNELTIVSALFNGNGNLLQGIQKTVTMHLKDETLEKKMGSGITLRTSFDVKPGNYLVRLVVRDAEAQLLSAESGAVRIP